MPLYGAYKAAQNLTAGQLLLALLAGVVLLVVLLFIAKRVSDQWFK